MNAPSAIQNVTSAAPTAMPALPPGTRYGRGTSGWLMRSLIAAGKINRYEISVVEMAMSARP